MQRQPSEARNLRTTDWLPSFTTVASMALVGASVYCTFRLVSAHGWQGAFWLVWQGSPYAPDIRERLELYDDLEETLQDRTSQVENLEDSLQQAKSLTEHSTSRLLGKWMSLLETNDLQKLLAGISHDLDKLASQVDEVHSEGAPEVKRRKKDISGLVVRLMERVDFLITAFTEALKAEASVMDDEQ